MIRVVPFDDADTQRVEIVHCSGVRVAPSDGDAVAGKQLGQRAHSRAGDADEMNRSRVSAICRRHFETADDSRLRLALIHQSEDVRSDIGRGSRPCSLERFDTHTRQSCGVGQ